MLSIDKDGGGPSPCLQSYGLLWKGGVQAAASVWSLPVMTRTLTASFPSPVTLGSALGRGVAGSFQRSC